MIIYWLRRDLRLSDNECFRYLLNTTEHEVLLYHQIHKEFKAWGDCRKKFYVESLEQINQQLEPFGQQLVLSHKPIVEQLQELKLQDHRVHEVIFTRSYNYHDLESEKNLSLFCEPNEIKTKKFDQMTLLPLRDLPFDIKELPKTFTQFRKKIEPVIQTHKINSLSIEKLPSSPQKIKLDSLGLDSLVSFIKNPTRIYFKGGELEAQKRLKYYFWTSHLVESYKNTRNGMVSFDDSTKLSPWLSLGSLSPRTIYLELKEYEAQEVANESTYWVLFELLWRDYFKFLALKYEKTFFEKVGINTPNLNHPEEKEHKRIFLEWCEGKTGSNFVDANMVELKKTGWMSNRGRQNAASYLAKHLNVDWTWGAKWFEKNLVDYDPESNWGNWAYVSGAGVDPRNRKFNIERQAKVYDPLSEYQKKFLPERF